jgi:Calcineurin-like phosphoesterase
MRPLAAIPALALTLAACASGQPATDAASSAEPRADVYAYSLVAPVSVSPSGLVARAVLPPTTRCPSLQVTGADPVQMDQRRPAATTKGAFDDVLVCSANIPAGAQKASVAGVEIPATMPRQVQTVAGLADTGCRIKGAVQDCNSTSAWPLQPIAEQIAKADPDLIIHVGDYFYREEKCPADKQDRCKGSPPPPKDVPFEDSGAGWIADFFEPARAMFGTAPLLAVRGNHEVCSKGGNGFYLFMDMRPGTEGACAPKQEGGALQPPVVITPTWSVDVPLISGRDLRLIVVDSANGYDYGLSPFSRRLRPEYRAAAKLADDSGVNPWLVTHQPPVGITSTKLNPGNIPDWQNWVADDQTAASHGLLSKYTAMVSGHLHLSQVIKVPGLPPQFVFGGGGTKLDPAQGYADPRYGPLSTSKGAPMIPGVKPYPKDEYRWIEVQHAFGLASPNPGQGAWDAKFVEPSGRTLATCTVRAGVPDCG